MALDLSIVVECEDTISPTAALLPLLILPWTGDHVTKIKLAVEAKFPRKGCGNKFGREGVENRHGRRDLLTTSG